MKAQQNRPSLQQRERQYIFDKELWLRSNKNATPEQIEAAFKAIAKRLGL